MEEENCVSIDLTNKNVWCIVNNEPKALIPEEYKNDLLKHSKLICTLYETFPDEDITIQFSSEKDYEAFKLIMDIYILFSTTEHPISYFMNIDMYKLKINIKKVIKYLIMDKENVYFTTFFDELNKMRSFDWNEFVQQTTYESMKKYVFDRIMRKDNRKNVNFHLFLNSFLLHYGEFNDNLFHTFLIVYNEYVINMKYLGHHFDFHYIYPKKMKMIYNELEFEIIQKWLFPRELYCMLDEDYSFEEKFCELIGKKTDNETIEKFMSVFLQTTLYNMNISGSSILYFLLRDYPMENVNDIDFWNTISNSSNFLFFIQKMFNFMKTAKNAEDMNNNNNNNNNNNSVICNFRNSIVDMKCSSSTKSIQFIQTDGTISDVIESFDLLCVTAYLGFENDDNTIYSTNFCLTTNFCETIMNKNMSHFYSIRNSLKPKYLNQIRLHKYNKRGFSLSSYLEHYMRDFNTDNVELEQIISEYKSHTICFQEISDDNEFYQKLKLSMFSSIPKVYLSNFIMNSYTVDLSDSTHFKKYYLALLDNELNHISKEIFDENCRIMKDFYMSISIEYTCNSLIYDTIEFISDIFHNFEVSDKFMVSSSFKMYFMDWDSGEPDDDFNYLDVSKPFPINHLKSKYPIYSFGSCCYLNKEYPKKGHIYKTVIVEDPEDSDIEDEIEIMCEDDNNYEYPYDPNLAIDMSDDESDFSLDF